MTLSGQPRSASSGSTGDQAAGKPAACNASAIVPCLPSVHGKVWRFRRRCSPEHPRVPILRCSRRSIFESPRSSSPSASPAAWPRVSPKQELRRFRLRCLLGHPRVLHLPAVPMGNARAAPHLLVHRQCRLAWAPGSPGSHAFRLSVSAGPGRPVNGHGWVNEVSPPSLKLCICCLARAFIRVSPLHARGWRRR